MEYLQSLYFAIFVFTLKTAEGHYWLGPSVEIGSGSKYYISNFSRGSETPEEACASQGWILATIHDAAAQAALEELANKMPSRRNICFGLTIYRNSTKRSIRGIWSDGTPFDNEISHRNWHQDEPTTYRKKVLRGEKVGVRMLASKLWQWDDYDKASKCGIACEETAVKETTQTITTEAETTTVQTTTEPTTDAPTTTEEVTTAEQTTTVEYTTEATTETTPATTPPTTQPPTTTEKTTLQQTTEATTVTTPIITTQPTTTQPTTTQPTTTQPTTVELTTTEQKTTAEVDLAAAGAKLVADLDNLESTPATVNAVASTLSNVLGAGDESFSANPELAKKILKSMDKFLGKYDVEKDGDFSSTNENLQIKIKKIGKDIPRADTERPSGLKKDNAISVDLSPQLLSEAYELKFGTEVQYRSRIGEPRGLQLNTVVYKSASLFQADRIAYKDVTPQSSNTTVRAKSVGKSTFGDGPTTQLIPVVLSEALSLDINNVTVKGLKNPLKIFKRINQQNFSAPSLPDMKLLKAAPVCAFWDVDVSDWSTEGCVTRTTENVGINENDAGAMITCECDHMTSFAVVLTTSYVYAPLYLEAVTIVGCSLSIPCLIAAILTILYFKQLRSQIAQQIIVHICLNLLALNIIFLVGIDRPEGKDHKLCMAASITLHYFLLAAWAWMLLEGIFLFLSLVIPLYARQVRGKIVHIGTFFAYGVPAVVSGLTAALSDEYLSEKYCWLSMTSLLPSLAIPIAAILFLNLMVFFSVLYVITCKSKMFRKNLDANKVRQAAKRGICLVFILGIPWIFGFLMLLSQDPTAKEAFAICFTVFNTTQGLAIFIAFCARQDQVRAMWKTCFETKFATVARSVRDHSSRSTSESRRQNLEEGRSTKLTVLEATQMSRATPQPSPAMAEKRSHDAGWT